MFSRENVRMKDTGWSFLAETIPTGYSSVTSILHRQRRVPESCFLPCSFFNKTIVPQTLRTIVRWQMNIKTVIFKERKSEANTCFLFFPIAICQCIHLWKDMFNTWAVQLSAYFSKVLLDDRPLIYNLKMCKHIGIHRHNVFLKI